MIQTDINNLVLYPSSGAEDESFVGLKIRGNIIEFYYPQAYHFNLDCKSIRSQIIDILKTISLAKTLEKNRADLFTSCDGEADFALDSYLWIINDFLANGFYVQHEKKYKLNQKGRVNWKKTLDNAPIVSKNGQVIYKDLIVEARSVADNLLVEIHKHCVKKSIDLIGWIFNMNSSFIPDKPFDEMVKKRYVSALEKEMSNTFEDKRRIMLSHMKNVIEGLDSNLKEREFVYGVVSYEYVFEKMIDFIFSNEDVTSFYPKGKWFLARNNFKPISTSDLRPDTILSNGEDIYILDSKYYRFGITGDSRYLPDTSSIQKQIVYGDFVVANMSNKYKRVFNVFLIPYDKLRNDFGSNSDLLYIGYARSEANHSNLPHENIHTFLIDLKHVVDCWNNKFCKNDQALLIQEIQKVLSKRQSLF